MDDIWHSNYNPMEGSFINCSSRFEGVSSDRSRYRNSSSFAVKKKNEKNRKRKNSRKKKKKLCGYDKLVSEKSSKTVQSLVGIDSNDIPLKRNLQIVIMGDFLGASLAEEEMLDVQQLLINEIYKIAFELRGPALKFHSSKVLNNGWLLLNCHDELTFEWVFDWSSTCGKSLKVVKAATAPWKPARICLTVAELMVDINCVIKLLVRQNSNLRVEMWKHIESYKMNGFWNLHFIVPGDGVRRLEGSCWQVHFFLQMIPVSVVEIQSKSSNVKYS